MSAARSSPRPCPPRPRSLHRDELGFERQEMVNWLGPMGLAVTGLQSLMSSIFGSYADKREVQGAFALSRLFFDYSQETGDFVLDYVADLGDGFDSTYAVAWTLARAAIEPEGCDEALPRGRLLVMGGDQVYPTAKLEQYRNRMLGPYAAALPCVVGDRPPELFAIPGNHDWYDGLTTFLRLFCQSRPGATRWVGGWRTRQERSYFALRLPHGWWLWGIDVQLHSEFDKPQLDYFLEVGERMQAEEGEQRVILVTGQPSWVHSGAADPDDSRRRWTRRSIPPSDAFSRLAYFERNLVRAAGARLCLVLSGDLHHYCRYEEVAPSPGAPATQRITAGGGGAYLFGTHQLPARLELVEAVSPAAPPTVYRRRATYPGEADSKRMARGILGLPLRNRGFAALLAVLYYLFAWLLESASLAVPERAGAAEGQVALSESIAGWALSWSDLWKVWEVLVVSPFGSAMALLVLGSLFGYAWSAGRAHRPWLPVLGVLHGLAHLALALWLIGGFAHLNTTALPALSERAAEWTGWPVDFGWSATHPLAVSLFTGEMLLMGGFLGALLFSLYLLIASRLFTAHTNEIYSSQRIRDSKCFLRLVIREEDGSLEVYPVGIERVPRRWRAVPDPAPPTAPWIEPDGARVEAHLIERPITVR